MSKDLHNSECRAWAAIFKIVNLFKLVDPLSRNPDHNITQNWRVCAICCRPGAELEVICGRDVKTVVDNVVVNLGVVRSNSLRDIKQEGQAIGGAVRNPTSLIPQRLSYIINTCYHLFRKGSCITVDRNNKTTPAIFVMHRSIMRLDYNHCNEK